MITIDLLSAPSGPKSKVYPAKTSILLNEVVRCINHAKRATIITGAGISCNAGIPDFRSSDGLYNLVKGKYPKNIVKGQDLFDVSLFRDEVSLAIFCTFMEGLYLLSRQATPTETHKFIKTMKEKDKLLRCYTQNIDSLEASINLNIGVNVEDFDNPKQFTSTWRNLDVVQLHGNLHKLLCTICFHTVDWTSEYQRELAAGLNPKCSKCEEKYIERLYSGKRITGTIGLLRPDIVLYGENHPQLEILTQGLNVDIKLKPDMLIVMGTSLKVDGVKKLVKTLSKSVRDKGGKVVFVNKTPLGKQWALFFDYEVLADCDLFVRVLKKEIPDLFLTQEQLDLKRLNGNTDVKEEVKEEMKEEMKGEIKGEILDTLTKKTQTIKKETKKVSIKKEPILEIQKKENVKVTVKKEPEDSLGKALAKKVQVANASKINPKNETNDSNKEKSEKTGQSVKPTEAAKTRTKSAMKRETEEIPQATKRSKQEHKNQEVHTNQEHTKTPLASPDNTNTTRKIPVRASARMRAMATPPVTPTKKRKPASTRKVGSAVRGD